MNPAAKPTRRYLYPAPGDRCNRCRQTYHAHLTPGNKSHRDCFKAHVYDFRLASSRTRAQSPASCRANQGKPRGRQANPARQHMKPPRCRKARECWVIWHKDSDHPAMYLGTNCDDTLAGTRRLLKAVNAVYDSKHVRIRRFVEREVKPTRKRK